MRKLVVTLIAACVALALFTVAFAEEMDLAGMSLEDLEALKNAVDMELYSRPEAGPFMLNIGKYTVGKDIPAGKFNVVIADASKEPSAILDAWTDSHIHEYLSLGDSPYGLMLEDGDTVTVERAPVLFKMSDFSEDELYQYTVPEGTYVPRGEYTVGEKGQIPVGTYCVYTATVKDAKVVVYLDKASYVVRDTQNAYSFEVTPIAPFTISLEEGTIIVPVVDIIMKKQAQFTFD